MAFGGRQFVARRRVEHAGDSPLVLLDGVAAIQQAGPQPAGRDSVSAFGRAPQILVDIGEARLRVW